MGFELSDNLRLLRRLVVIFILEEAFLFVYLLLQYLHLNQLELFLVGIACLGLLGSIMADFDYLIHQNISFLLGFDVDDFSLVAKSKIPPFQILPYFFLL